MRPVTIVTAVLLLALAALASPALAMQPPGSGAADNFGCVDNEDSAVAGHPGARGLLHSTPMVAELTGDPMPTAWNAVEHADPIDLGSC